MDFIKENGTKDGANKHSMERLNGYKQQEEDQEMDHIPQSSHKIEKYQCAESSNYLSYNKNGSSISHDCEKSHDHVLGRKLQKRKLYNGCAEIDPNRNKYLKTLLTSHSDNFKEKNPYNIMQDLQSTIDNHFEKKYDHNEKKISKLKEDLSSTLEKAVYHKEQKRKQGSDCVESDLIRTDKLKALLTSHPNKFKEKNHYNLKEDLQSSNDDHFEKKYDNNEEKLCKLKEQLQSVLDAHFEKAFYGKEKNPVN